MSSSDDDFDSQLQSYMKARGWKEYCAMKELTSTFDYNGWRVWNSTLRMVIFFYGSEVVINKEKPKEPVETSSEEEKAEFTTWEWKNDLVLNIMKTKLCSGIYSSLESKTKYSGNAKQMMDALEQMAVEREKMFAHITLGELVKMRYDGEGDVRKYLTEMELVVERLKAVEVNLPEYLVNQLALNSLPRQFATLRTSYNLLEKKWDWMALVNRCVGAEELIRIRNMYREEEGSNSHQQGGNGARRRSNAKQRLDASEQMVLQKERDQATETLQKLMGMRYDGEGDVGEFLLEMEAIAGKLSALDVEFPDYFRHKCINCENLLRLLREGRRKGENRSEQQGGDVEKKRNKVRCFSCGKKGHIAKNCQLAST